MLMSFANAGFSSGLRCNSTFLRHVGGRKLNPFLAIATAFLVCTQQAGAQSPSADPVNSFPELQARLDALATPEGRVIAGARIAGYTFLPQLYQAAGAQLVWSNAANVASLKEAVRRSWEDGLLSADFHDKIIADFEPSKPGNKDAAAIDRDIILSDTLVRLLYQLYFGKVSPNGLDANWNFARPLLSDEPTRIIADALSNGSIGELIEKTKLAHPFYKSLKATLQKYTQYEVMGGWPAVPPGPVLKPDATDPRIPALRKRLAITGEYQDDGNVQSEVFDEPLAAAVRSFQTSHGLEAAGTLGPQTLEALNVSVQQRIEQIRVNMERARWILRTIGDEMVIVNVAGYYLRIILEGKAAWSTRVIVGQNHHKTPIFTEQIKHVVFNPDWTVPRSIVRNEIFPKARANPGYLAAHNYRLTNGSTTVDPSAVNWSQWTAATFPFGVVQSPGPTNALGLVKFLFPNKYSVYLHDTPGRGLFVKADRTFSHGCIRVEDPLKMAEIILGNRLGWDRAKIDSIVATGKLTQVSLPKPLPVLLLYWTVDPQLGGNANFFRDIYGRDARLLKALNSEFEPKPVAVTP
jgi:murein L,D-transpeptidase YcbB/YkuD